MLFLLVTSCTAIYPPAALFVANQHLGLIEDLNANLTGSEKGDSQMLFYFDRCGWFERPSWQMFCLRRKCSLLFSLENRRGLLMQMNDTCRYNAARIITSEIPKFISALITF